MGRAVVHMHRLALTFAASMVVALACGDPWDWQQTPYRCRPSSAAQDRCPNDELCCSDDAAALDPAALDMPALPNFDATQLAAGVGVPLFAAARNDASEWGVCIQAGSVAPAFALANGCPIPCNPTWDGAAIDTVCGEGMLCCQTVELDAADCVFDPARGDAGCWRAARGDDIVGLGGLDVTDWGADAHVTHQDPGGSECERFVDGLTSAQLDDAGVGRDALLRGCLRRLVAADQRGFCLGGPGVSGCPLAQPDYRDACEQRNDAEGQVGCG